MIRQGVRICRYAVRIIPKCCPDVTGNSVRMLPKYAIDFTFLFESFSGLRGRRVLHLKKLAHLS
ncbi:MAG: hypothetical protein WBF68_09245 [Atribacterota bacterium]